MSNSKSTPSGIDCPVIVKGDEGGVTIENGYKIRISYKLISTVIAGGGILGLMGGVGGGYAQDRLPLALEPINVRQQVADDDRKNISTRVLNVEQTLAATHATMLANYEHMRNGIDDLQDDMKVIMRTMNTLQVIKNIGEYQQ